MGKGSSRGAAPRTPAPPAPATGAWVRQLRRQLRAASRPSSGSDARSYLGSPVPVLEVRSPDVRRIASDFCRGHRDLDLATVWNVAEALWRGRWFEERILAVELLRRWVRLLDDDAWRTLDRWVDDVSGWGLTDALAGGLLGPLVLGHPERIRDLARWGRSPNPWRRRASLYALSRTVRSGELGPAFRLIDPLRADPDRWVQRAVGTWLRECWKVDTARTERYLTRRSADIAPVALTVALERATTEQRARLRTLARRARSHRPGP